MNSLTLSFLLLRMDNSNVYVSELGIHTNVNSLYISTQPRATYIEANEN